jgi:hypothetical protein
VLFIDKLILKFELKKSIFPVLLLNITHWFASISTPFTIKLRGGGDSVRGGLKGIPLLIKNFNWQPVILNKYIEPPPGNIFLKHNVVRLLFKYVSVNFDDLYFV